VFIAVPTHALGEQIVRDMESKGSARVYRSRDASDPASPLGVNMCVEDDRIIAIQGALGISIKAPATAVEESASFTSHAGINDRSKIRPMLGSALTNCCFIRCRISFPRRIP